MLSSTDRCEYEENKDFLHEEKCFVLEGDPKVSKEPVPLSAITRKHNTRAEKRAIEKLRQDALRVRNAEILGSSSFINENPSGSSASGSITNSREPSEVREKSAVTELDNFGQDGGNDSAHDLIARIEDSRSETEGQDYQGFYSCPPQATLEKVLQFEMMAKSLRTKFNEEQKRLKEHTHYQYQDPETEDGEMKVELLKNSNIWIDPADKKLIRTVYKHSATEMTRRTFASLFGSQMDFSQMSKSGRGNSNGPLIGFPQHLLNDVFRFVSKYRDDNKKFDQRAFNRCITNMCNAARNPKSPHRSSARKRIRANPIRKTRKQPGSQDNMNIQEKTHESTIATAIPHILSSPSQNYPSPSSQYSTNDYPPMHHFSPNQYQFPTNPCPQTQYDPNNYPQNQYLPSSYLPNTEKPSTSKAASTEFAESRKAPSPQFNPISKLEYTSDNSTSGQDSS
ncbi:uncharacterized protein LOC117182798 [Belonocnema kinseyi]|uniref:uncharacterized protein LOC117182798 n=1 Tax=Belonocnema kinseyi TaxID=2817044 RepID=UPI00143D0600|nr:uncharacterized protein LOC117182798 [Belonocnema kinseyi]